MRNCFSMQFGIISERNIFVDGSKALWSVLREHRRNVAHPRPLSF